MKSKIGLAIIIIALIVGGAVSFYSWGKINDYQEKQLELVPVVVASNDIEQYSLLSYNNIKIENVPARFVDEFSIADINLARDKMTLIPLYAGKPIDARTISDKPEDIGNRQVVGVHIDMVRFAGVSDGDTVDIYWVNTGDKAMPADKIASNAIVLKVTDDKGVSVNNSMNISRSAAASAGLIDAKNPKIIYLLLNPEEVPYVIKGSSPGNGSISLAKKPDNN